MPPSAMIEKIRAEGIHVNDAAQAMAAGRTLRQAILDGELDLFAIFPSRDTPIRLHDQALIEAAFPSDSAVLTFIYIDRHPRAPFGLSAQDLKELTRDPLCLQEKPFCGWMRKQERKKAWPCNSGGRETQRPEGRPSNLIDDAIEAIEELSAKGELTPSTPTKVVRAQLQSARPSLRTVSEETVRRARKQVSYRVT
jgi:hypothetical protein